LCRTAYYLVISNYGQLGPAVVETDLGEADLKTATNDLMSDQYSKPGSHRRV
jgi:hypothetical protein